MGTVFDKPPSISDAAANQAEINPTARFQDAHNKRSQSILTDKGPASPAMRSKNVLTVDVAVNMRRQVKQEHISIAAPSFGPGELHANCFSVVTTSQMNPDFSKTIIVTPPVINKKLLDKAKAFNSYPGLGSQLAKVEQFSSNDSTDKLPALSNKQRKRKKRHRSCATKKIESGA
mmetsp:Transcript_21823/g.39792  ORF Transcript_21823/g.39792 Transcript_21823/m.39792 type:complete len:175 (+) Transcript_21823:26-550(+)